MDLNELKQDLAGPQTQENRILTLKDKYLHLWFLVMKRLGRNVEVQEFMEHCKNLEEMRFFSLHIHGYFIPWLLEQKFAGNLKKGK